MRGITQPDGTAEFNEVFFDDARCPKDNVVGGVNNGWMVANTTLAFERGMSATTGYRRFEEELDLHGRRGHGQRSRSPTRSSASGWRRYHTKIQILRINGLRSLSATLQGKQGPGVAALGATNKMFWSEMHREAMELALDIFGAGAHAGRHRRRPTARGPAQRAIARREGYPVSPMMSAFFFSRSETIWGGTAEIQRNIVGERVLGLPRERDQASVAPQFGSFQSAPNDPNSVAP